MTKDCPQCARENRKTVLSNSGENFKVAGKVQFIYAIDLKNFIVDDDRPYFERLRGNERLADAIKRATQKNLPSFSPDVEEDKTVDEGHRFAAFRTRFVEGWLFDTFYPNDKAKPNKSSRLFPLWEEYFCHVRLSRFGSVEVKLTRYIPSAYRRNTNSGEREGLINMLKGLLNIRLSGASANLESRLAIDIAARFVSEISKLEIEASDNGVKQNIPLRMKPYIEGSNENSRVYERYTVLILEHIECKNCDYRIDAKVFWDDHKPAIGAILEGNLLETITIDENNNEHKNISIPSIDEHGIAHLRDLGSWQNDLCFFTHERALLYYPEVRMMITPFSSEIFGDTSISYERYWRCIIRIIEHTVSMRTAIHILESQTTKALSGVSDLTRKVIADSIITDEEKRSIRKMADDMSKNFSVLPYLRDSLVPSSNLRASYAANKFEYLTERVFRLNYSLTHIERNIDEAFEFLQYFKSVQLQSDSEREQRIEQSFARIGAIIAFLALVAVGPSFVGDFSALFKDRYCASIDGSLFLLSFNACDHAIGLAVVSYIVMITLGFLIIIFIYRNAKKS